MTEIEDRFLEVALEETTGQAPPPDLTEAVLGALRSSADRSTCRIVHLPRRSNRIALPCLVAWSAVSAGVLGLLLMAVGRDGDPGSVRAVDTLRVTRGKVTWEGAEPALPMYRGDTATVAIGAGDRLSTHARPASLRIGDLTAVHPEPYTILEVYDMQLASKKGAVVLGSLTLAVVAGAVTWDALSLSEPMGPGTRLTLRAAEQDQPAAELDHRSTALERTVEQPEVQQQAGEAPVPDETADADEQPAARFSTAKFRDALQAVDWKRFGETMTEMSRINGEIAEYTLAGEEVPRELIAKHRQLSGLLLELAQPMMKGGVPGEGGNGAFSHPLAVANTIDYTLEAAGLSLEAGQLYWLQRITSHYAAEDDNLRIAAGQDLASANFLREMEMKRAMYEEMRQGLSPEQQELLFPDAARDRNQLELLGVGGDWGGFARTVPARGPEEYARVMTTAFQSSLGLSEGQAAQVGKLLEDYSRSYPRSYWDNQSSELDRRGFMEVDRIHFVAERQVALIRGILQRVELTPEQREQLMRTRNVLVPLPR